jgi:hypothetical protein
MYDASVPVFVKMLGNLANILDKGKAYCEAKKVNPSVLINTRLIPDMFPLVEQVQVATRHVHWACALLAGQERPNLTNTETTFEELKQRIATAVQFAQSFKKEQIDGSEDRHIKLVLALRTIELNGQSYLLHFAMPNFYFHVTTAYAILRHVGVEIGKRDFVG